VPSNVPFPHMCGGGADRYTWLHRLTSAGDPSRVRTNVMTSDIALPRMDSAAVYRVRVRGRLDARWVRDVSGIHVTEEQGPGGEFQTILVGRVLDQAALFGILNSLYELHMPVLSVVCLEGDGASNGADGVR